MPYAGSDFTNADVGETVTYFFDFTGALAAGETISSVTWTAAVAQDSLMFDPSAAGIVNGPPNITGNVVGQRFAGMVANVKYLVTATAITNQGNHLITFSHFFADVPA